MARRHDLSEYYRLLRRHFGPQHWWPGKTPFEVCVGAILTQNTAWSNVEKAIANLKRAGALSPRVLYRLHEREIARLVRPSGYFNVKARRLKAFVAFLAEERRGKLQGVTRDELLSVSGIGPETADSILLYACDQPVFVVDAYTRRVLVRHGIIPPSATYEEIQRLFREPSLFNDFHAQFVAVGKTFCRPRVAWCAKCPLRVVL